MVVIRGLGLVQPGLALKTVAAAWLILRPPPQVDRCPLKAFRESLDLTGGPAERLPHPLCSCGGSASENRCAWPDAAELGEDPCRGHGWGVATGNCDVCVAIVMAFFHRKGGIFWELLNKALIQAIRPRRRIGMRQIRAMVCGRGFRHQPVARSQQLRRWPWLTTPGVGPFRERAHDRSAPARQPPGCSAGLCSWPRPWRP